MRYLTPVPKQFVDHSGIPYSDGTVSVYLSGDSGLADIYEDAEGDALYPNPCRLDANGAWQCFVPGGVPLDYIVKDKNGNVVFEFYDILPSGGGTAVYNIMGVEGETAVTKRSNAEGNITATVGLDTEFKQRVTDAENDIGDLNESVDGVEGTIQELNDDLDHLDDRVEVVEDQIGQLTVSLSGKKDKQAPIVVSSIPSNKTVKRIFQNENGVIDFDIQDIELPGYSQRIEDIENEQVADAKVTAAALNDLNARLAALESEGDNIGDVVADSLNSQNLFEGGIRVKVRQAAKSLDGATNKTVTNVYQDENGVITVTYSAIAFPDWTSTITAATDLCEKLANKKTTFDGFETSDTFYPTLKAVVDYLDSRLQNLGGKKITNNGQPFTSDSQLPSSTPYYGQNINTDDYAFVQDTGLASRYTASVTGSSVSWSLDYEIALPVFTAEQQAAIDSGATSTKVGNYDAHLANTNNPHGVTAAQVGALTPTGNGSDVTAAFTAAGSRVNISTGEKLSVIFGKIAKWFSDLKALAFKDNVSDSDISGTIADAHIASASTWNGKQDALPIIGSAMDTYAVNVTGTAMHLDAYGEWSTWASGEYDSSKPYVKIAEKYWALSGNSGAGQLFQIEYNNSYFVRLRLSFRTQGSSGFTSHQVQVLESNITRAELEDRIQINYFTYNGGANACIHIYVKFTGLWQNWRVRQLDAQSGDNGHDNWVPFDFFRGHGVGVASPQGTRAEYVYLVDNALSSGSENPVQNKVLTAALASKVDSTDSRLLPNSDEFVATYSTQSSGTTMEELRTAYVAGKKIYVLIGGAMGSDTYEEKVPLTYVRYQGTTIVGFFFETQVDPVIDPTQAGAMVTYWRSSLGQSSGWGRTVGNVAYATAASTAGVADAASDYVENSNLASALAGRMFKNASNAESGSLQNLLSQMSATVMNATPGTEILTSYPNDDGFNKQGYVNAPYKMTVSRLTAGIAEILKSSGEIGLAPLIATLISPKYYQDGRTVSYMSLRADVISVNTYYVLGNRNNVSGSWGLCNCPATGSFVEIDLDVSVILDAGGDVGGEYLMNFTATCHEDDGSAFVTFNVSDSYRFAETNLMFGFASSAVYSMTHVRLSGYIPSGTSMSSKAIFVGGCVPMTINGRTARVMMTNVKIVIHQKTLSWS